MTLLNFTIDTDELGYDEDGYKNSFKDEFHSSIISRITKMVVGNVTNEEVGQYSILVQEKVQGGVDDLFNTLLNEDVVISDGYGRKKFVGNVEDYIKKEIDDRYLHSVDGNGKRLSGCSTQENTWVQWYLENKCKEYMDRAISSAKDKIEKTINRHMRDVLDSFIEETLKKRANEKLIEMGLKL